MDLSATSISGQLALVDDQGWDGDAGRDLLLHVRRAVVEPTVRRAGLSGPAADQAAASAWAAGWDALRRPSARTAANPAGMVWVAVRRAVWAETAAARPVPPVAGRPVPPDGPAERVTGGPDGLGPHLDPLVGALVAQGWDRDRLIDVVLHFCDDARSARSGPGSGSTRWRSVAVRCGIPQWQARRLAAVLLGDSRAPAVLTLLLEHGPWVLADGAVGAALKSTRHRSVPPPEVHLRGWRPRLADPLEDRQYVHVRQIAPNT